MLSALLLLLFVDLIFTGIFQAFARRFEHRTLANTKMSFIPVIPIESSLSHSQCSWASLHRGNGTRLVLFG